MKNWIVNENEILYKNHELLLDITLRCTMQTIHQRNVENIKSGIKIPAKLECLKTSAQNLILSRA